MIHDREDCLMPLIKSPCATANNNTRLASGLLRRKNKLEGVVQKRIARIIAITLGLSRRKALCATLHSRKVFFCISGSVIKAGDALPSTHMDPRCIDSCVRLHLPSCVLQARCQVHSVHCRLSTSPFPTWRATSIPGLIHLGRHPPVYRQRKDKKYLDR